ncbi:hypothetical protein BDR06DRAFT_956582 [Suillus hirtellus]|nr:hypothetical protein BDR06DRAFT_956582 [Suillus hirtellus]
MDMHQDAQTVLENINGKLSRGRKLPVTFAYQVSLEPGGQSDARPTILSMMKKWNSYSVERYRYQQDYDEGKVTPDGIKPHQFI